jgi:hypothetical protein
MINTKYKIDLYSDFNQGGYCALYSINDHSNKAFKEFITKSRAEYARKIQVKLSRYNLAPKVFSKLCKLKYETLFPAQKSGWGYITEKALPANHTKHTMILLQDLVEEIEVKTKLKFWDCHWHNIGFVKRGKYKKLVCVDTGEESFSGYSNAWGNPDPGPKCSYCNTYDCKCEE